MSFPVQFVLSPYAQELLHTQMVEHGEDSVKKTVKRVLIEGAQDREVVERAVEMAKRMRRERRG